MTALCVCIVETGFTKIHNKYTLKTILIIMRWSFLNAPLSSEFTFKYLDKLHTFICKMRAIRALTVPM